MVIIVMGLLPPICWQTFF